MCACGTNRKAHSSLGRGTRPHAKQPFQHDSEGSSSKIVRRSYLHTCDFVTAWQQEGAELVLRQSGQVDSGKRVHVYGADMRRRVALQFWPDGYEWAEAEPVVLAEVQVCQQS